MQDTCIPPPYHTLTHLHTPRHLGGGGGGGGEGGWETSPPQGQCCKKPERLLFAFNRVVNVAHVHVHGVNHLFSHVCGPARDLL
jgi:hypothetical protein